ncbi:MAG: triose-phosphate isomerase [Pseudomonadales bacterium]
MTHPSRRPLVIGNWKMHGTQASSVELLQAIQQSTQSATHTNVAVCVPFPYLQLCREQLANGRIQWGAQNLSEHAQGAYTGEVSATMLADWGCRFVLVGHSERRALYGEMDDHVVAKIRQALSAGITPVLCVGETLAERERGATEIVVSRQLNAALDHLQPAELEQLVVAYEPVWAIGTGRTATPEQAQAVHAHIRARWAEKLPSHADKLLVLYGGSVKADNARPLFAQPDVDGGLVGGAALDPDQFCAIINAAEQAWNH